MRTDLIAPTAALLPRVGDRLSFCYLDMVRLVRDDYGVRAQSEQEGWMYLPVASLSVVMLGPGCSITTPALAAILGSGAVVCITGRDGLSYYGHVTGKRGGTNLLERQVALWSDSTERLRVARKMFIMRFGEEAADLEGASLQRLRGLEGARMRAIYRVNAKRHALSFRRNYDWDHWDEASPVNRALSAANHALYGVVLCVVAGLGLSPALGFVHTGHQQSLVFDIADLYKAELTIPAAFAAAKEDNPEGAVRRRLRHNFTLLRAIPRMVDNIFALLDVPVASAPESFTNIVELWGPNGTLPGGHNWGEGICS